MTLSTLGYNSVVAVKVHTDRIDRTIYVILQRMQIFIVAYVFSCRMKVAQITVYSGIIRVVETTTLSRRVV